MLAGSVLGLAMGCAFNVAGTFGSRTRADAGRLGRGVTRDLPHAHVFTPNADVTFAVQSCGSDHEASAERTELVEDDGRAVIVAVAVAVAVREATRMRVSVTVKGVKSGSPATRSRAVLTSCTVTVERMVSVVVVVARSGNAEGGVVKIGSDCAPLLEDSEDDGGRAVGAAAVGSGPARMTLPAEM